MVDVMFKCFAKDGESVGRRGVRDIYGVSRRLDGDWGSVLLGVSYTAESDKLNNLKFAPVRDWDCVSNT